MHVKMLQQNVATMLQQNVATMLQQNVATMLQQCCNKMFFGAVHVFSKSIIINTGHSSGPGIHWVAMILLADECLYFDPFGVSIVETEILDYVKLRYQSFSYSNTCIQGLKSNKCGAFCVSFISVSYTHLRAHET